MKKNIMNQELKEKAYRVLIDSLDVTVFEKYLYKLVDENELKSNSLLFDFVNIDYKSGNYNKKVAGFLKDSCTDDELLCLEIYSKSKKILKNTEDTVVLQLVESISKLNVKTEYQYDLLYNFYLLNVGTLPDSYFYYHLTKEEIIIKAKLFSEKVISKFNFYKKNEDWYGFLNCIIEKEETKNDVKISNYIPIKQNESLFSRTINLFKVMLGIK